MRTRRAYASGISRPRRATVAAILVVLVPALAAANGFLVSGRFSNNVLLFDATTGAFQRVFASGSGLVNAIGMDFGPDGDLFVASGDESKVFRFDGDTGDFVSVVIVDDPLTPEDETNNLQNPRGLTFGPGGLLYVASGGSARVNAYDGTTGVFVRTAASGGGLSGPIGVTFGSDGLLYVAGGLSGMVHRYDASTGAFVDVFADVPNTTNATGLAFGPNGNLFVGSGDLQSVFEFDGTTGALVRVAASGNGLGAVIGIGFDANDLLYVTSFQTNSVLRFDLTGAFVDEFVTSGAGGLDGTHFFLFTPGTVRVTPTSLGAFKGRFR